MRKSFMGVRLKRLREERGLTQVALARALELSPSYLNQLEQNQRPLTVAVLLKLNAVFGVDVQRFSEDDEVRLIAGLRELFSETLAEEAVSLAEMEELAANMPGVARMLIRLGRRQRDIREREEILAARMGQDRGGAPALRPMPYEEVRDFFYDCHNYIDAIDTLAERAASDWGLTPRDCAARLEARLEWHGIRVLREECAERGELLRRFDSGQRALKLSPRLRPGQMAFQMATQLAFLEARDALEAVSGEARLSSEEARRLLGIGLANYFAGALILPYRRFLGEAERLGYDIERLAHDFCVSFETVCHRLSTLQRAEQRGVPFFFVRVDRAGNISKRQSATDFHFSRVGGSCPLWNLYEAFAQPGRILTQLATMPDGRAYLWLARTVTHGHPGYDAPEKTFAVGLGCDIRHAERLVYSRSLNLKDSAHFTPIGAGCKLCPREHCAQRAFPALGAQLAIDENSSCFTPYTIKPADGADMRRTASPAGVASPS
ncbi:MAG: short-chain fatty acyl-CoA regulator family protein [Zoogloeaceae bacterium]|jgi:predicted transcriptional regulator/transcriptional regulator with XRE-family HTH domain|nr:short-chain fatty acyl-CoA regulator family protein [Zoogloeaceae bacterium]